VANRRGKVQLVLGDDTSVSAFEFTASRTSVHWVETNTLESRVGSGCP